MNHFKVLLLVFIFACVSGIGFTYCLYQKQSQAQGFYAKGQPAPAPPPAKPPKPPEPEDPNAPPRRTKFLEEDLRLGLAKASPIQRMNQLEGLRAQAQNHQALLTQHLASSQRLCEGVHCYVKGASTVDPLAQKLAANLLDSFEKRQGQAKAQLEGLDTHSSLIEEELEEIKHTFLKA